MSDTPGNVKVTRADWLNVAKDALISDGVDQVKVLLLSERLDVSRSSFYWYFKSRSDLLDALLDDWEKTNTAALTKQAETPAPSITAAVCNIFRCVIDTEMFNTPLDFAIRDWARKSGKVRRALDQSDATRIAAITAMFARYDYPADEARTRALVLYYMQMGYNAADLQEPLEDRLKQVPDYLYVFTGQRVQDGELEAFSRFARAVADRN
ncbi:TetR/AcrR family transcriptional regulator [Thalassococcus sp. S3]|uniref:TetR/AcrR family transcriptional regulator n=1 Tax=Thalassococcus sp. S3 TaxID=2017482 RepID=UPI00102441BA|nr:TetR/AcrR family transcriptional regulator [Thalassococcus sp. S3]QBF33025.1 TetR family transcriptional regulator [Thalassococcus sp. S3]